MQGSLNGGEAVTYMVIYLAARMVLLQDSKVVLLSLITQGEQTNEIECEALRTHVPSVTLEAIRSPLRENHAILHRTCVLEKKFS